MKEKLIELGLSDSQIKSILEEQAKELNGYIKKDKYDEKQKERDELNKQLKERDEQLNNLKKGYGDNEELKQRIAELQKTNEETETKFNKQINEFKLNSAIENVANKSGAKNVKALKSLLNFETIIVSDDGVVGLDEQINKLKETESYLFKNETVVNPVINSKKVVKEETNSFDKFLEQKKKEQESLKGLSEVKVIN
jgi:hypothetical protein